MFTKLYAIGVTAFFLIMIALLTRDHVLPSLERSAGIDVDRRVLMDSWANLDDYNVIRLDEMRLGAVRMVAEVVREPIAAEDAPDQATYYTSGAHLEIRTPLFSGRLLMSSRMNRRLELEQALLRVHIASFGQRLMDPEELAAESLPAGAYELAGRVDGNLMRIRLRRDDAVQFREYRLAKPVTMSDSLTPILRGNMLTRNVTYSMDVYEPMLGGNAGQVQVEWVGEERVPDPDGVMQISREIELRFQNTVTRVFVDPAGQIARREIPLFAAGSSMAQQVGGGKLILDRLEPATAGAAYPSLAFMMEPPNLAAAELRGEDNGQVIRMSLLNMVAGGLGSSVAGQ